MLLAEEVLLVVLFARDEEEEEEEEEAATRVDIVIMCARLLPLCVFFSFHFFFPLHVLFRVFIKP